MKKFIWISLCSILAIFIVMAVFVLENDYRVTVADCYYPYTGAIDIYNASREELRELDLCNYSVTFGEVESENEAFQIAAKVIEEIYKKDESPYIVKFNENANAWIVSGSRSLFRLGGVASIAIDKETGEIIMLLHTK